MRRPRATLQFVIGVFLGLPRPPLPANVPFQFQEAASMPSEKTPAASAREKAGLRGPVRQCTEERTTPPSPGYSERNTPGQRNMTRKEESSRPSPSTQMDRNGSLPI